MKICIKRSEEITDINVGLFSELASSRSQQDTVDIFCSSWARKGILKHIFSGVPNLFQNANTEVTFLWKSFELCLKYAQH